MYSLTVMRAMLTTTDTGVGHTCTVRAVLDNGDTRLLSGFYTDLGCPVTGSMLDPEPEDMYEVGRTEYEVEFPMDSMSRIASASAWIQDHREGQTYLFRDTAAEEVVIPLDDTRRIVVPNKYRFTRGNYEQQD